jgi:hypothetical protein
VQWVIATAHAYGTLMKFGYPHGKRGVRSLFDR